MTHSHSAEHSHGHAHAQEHPEGHAPGERHNHAHPSRRDFFARLLGGALAGVPLLELAFNRAAWARALAPTVAGQRLFDIEKAAKDVYLAIARPRRMINSSSAIFVGSRDVLVVDSQAQPSVTAALIDQIKREVTNKPVRYVVNTHFHDDHVQGNSAYRRRGGEIDFIAHTATAELMAQEGRPRLKVTLERSVPSLIEGGRELAAKATSAPEKAFWEEQVRHLLAYQAEMKSFELELPTLTVDRTHVIKDRGHDLHIEFRGRAHTAGDVVVFCPQKKVVATGDMILGGMPYMPDSYPREWPRTIDSVGALEFTRILPAHGPILSRGRMNNLRDFIVEVNERVEAARKAGLSREETRAAISVDSLKSLRADGYGDFMFAVRDSLFPHWQRTFLALRPDRQGSLDGVIGNVYQHLDRK